MNPIVHDIHTIFSVNSIVLNRVGNVKFNRP